MAQWSYPQGHPSGYENDADARSAASNAHSRHASNTSSGYGITTIHSPSAQRPGLQIPPARNLELPPLMRTSASPSIPRSVKLPSVLNSVPDDGPTSNQRRRKADEVDSPSEGFPTLPPLMPTSRGPASIASSGRTSPLPLLTEPANHPARKMLTPKSPLRRAISLSHLNRPSGVVDAHQNPFPVSPRSRPYAVEPGTSGAPPLPTPPAGGYGLPSILQTEHLPRGGSPEAGSAHRYSASPSPAYSSYTQIDQTSPTGDMRGYLSVSDTGRGGRGLSQPPVTSAPHGQESYQVPISSGPSQNTYQMMTLKTTEGDVRFPVDVQAASRVADEKRRRNAGASARFRERRKRKEMEASQTIAKLEQQYKEVAEDADFYKRERDMLTTIMAQLPGGNNHLPRPQSPRTRRNVSMPTGSGQGPFAGSDRGSPGPSRHVRRRTSSFPSGEAPRNFSQAFPPAPPMGYAPPPPPQAQATQQHFSSHPQHSHTSAHAAHTPTLPPPPTTHSAGPASVQMSSLPPPPPSLLQAPPMTGPINPFARHEANSRMRPQGH